MKRLLTTTVLCVLLVSLAVPVRAAQDLAALCPADAVFYAEVRSPDEVLAFLEGWLKTQLEGQGQDPVKQMLADAAGELKMTPEELPDMLYVLKVRDVARATNVMQKVEKAARDEMDDLVIKEERVNGVAVRYIAGDAAADSDYAWAMLDDHLLLSNHRRVVTEALKTHAARRCILDERTARDVLTRLHDPSSKLLLLNVAGFQPPGARNPNAPAPGMIGITTLETDRRIDVVADFSSMGELMRFFLGLAMNAMGG